MGLLVGLALVALVGLSLALYRLWTSTPRPVLRHRGRAAAMLATAVVWVALAIQLVPFGHDHSNPSVVNEPAWDSLHTRELVARACFDCHSNEVVWPWYSNIAPFSWLIAADVQGGREGLNFSEWDRPQRVREAAEAVSEGEMPPFLFSLVNARGRLSDQEKQDLIDGLRRTFSAGAVNVQPAD